MGQLRISVIMYFVVQSTRIRTKDLPQGLTSISKSKIRLESYLLHCLLRNSFTNRIITIEDCSGIFGVWGLGRPSRLQRRHLGLRDRCATQTASGHAKTLQVTPVMQFNFGKMGIYNCIELKIIVHKAPFDLATYTHP